MGWFRDNYYNLFFGLMLLKFILYTIAYLLDRISDKKSERNRKKQYEEYERKFGNQEEKKDGND